MEISKFTIDRKFLTVSFDFSLHRHFSSPISTVVRGRKGLVSSNNSKTRSIISDSHHDRTIFGRARDGRPKVFAPVSRGHWIALSGSRAGPPLFCQVLLPRASPRFGNATLQVEAIRASWKSPRLTFVPITPSLINYAAQAVGLESIRGRRRPPLPSRSCSFHRPLEFLFPNTFLLYVAFRDF